MKSMSSSWENLIIQLHLRALRICSPKPVRTIAPKSAMYCPLRKVATLPPTRSCRLKKAFHFLKKKQENIDKIGKKQKWKEQAVIS